jgi:hypothetical protein
MVLTIGTGEPTPLPPPVHGRGNRSFFFSPAEAGSRIAELTLAAPPWPGYIPEPIEQESPSDA